jgi:hypothetical protein
VPPLAQFAMIILQLFTVSVGINHPKLGDHMAGTREMMMIKG